MVRLERVRTLTAIGAHPDDIEIGAGGLLLSTAPHKVHYVLLTGTPDRLQEARSAAAAFLPAATITFAFAGLPDGRLPADWSATKEALHAAEAFHQADLVLAPSAYDAHQDHRLVAELIPTAFRRSQILHYEIPKWDGDLGRPNTYVPLTEAIAHRKVELLNACYPSQKGRDWWDDEFFLALPRLRGAECRHRYAEAFTSTKMILELA